LIRCNGGGLLRSDWRYCPRQQQERKNQLGEQSTKHKNDRDAAASNNNMALALSRRRLLMPGACAEMYMLTLRADFPKLVDSVTNACLEFLC